MKEDDDFMCIILIVLLLLYFWIYCCIEIVFKTSISGREQAKLTGSRLKDLELPYSVLISSTMTRAVETAQLIHQFMPDLKHVTDDCLREGAPIPPEPPIGSWRPEPKVTFQL